MRNSGRSFSLIEVVVAIGVFAIGVVIVISLLTRMGMATDSILEEKSAQRILDLVEWGLKDEGYLNLIDLTDKAWYLTRDGTDFVDEEADDSYFRVDISNRGVAGTAGYLEFDVVVSWPVRRANQQSVPFPQRRSLFFVTVVNL